MLRIKKPLPFSQCLRTGFILGALLSVCVPLSAQESTTFRVPLEEIIASDNHRAHIVMTGAFRIRNKALFARTFGKVTRASDWILSVLSAELRRIGGSLPKTAIMQPAQWQSKLLKAFHSQCAKSLTEQICPIEMTALKVFAYEFGKAPPEPVPPPPPLLPLSDNLWELKTRIASLTKQGNRVEARRHAEHALKVATRNNAVPAILEYFRAILAEQRDIDGKPEEAEKLYTQAWRAAHNFALSGLEGQAALRILPGFAKNQFRQRKWVESEKLYSRLLAHYIKLYGSENLFVADAASKLGDIYRALKRHDDALRVDRLPIKAAEAMDRRFPKNTGSLSFVSFALVLRLAQSLENTGNTKDAEAAYLRVLAMLPNAKNYSASKSINGKTYRANHGIALVTIADFYVRHKMFGKAEGKLNQAMEFFRQVKANRPANLRAVAARLEEVYRATGREGEIDQLRRTLQLP